MQSPSVTQRAKPPVPHIRCLSDPDLLNPEVQAPGKHKSNERLQLAHRALLVVEAPSSRNGRKIKHFLNSLRIDVKVVSKSKTFPPLSSKKSARYAVIVFENYNSYLKLDSWSRQLIDKYCRDYHVGIVGFIRPPREEGTHVSFVDGYQLTIQYKLELEDIKLNFDSYVWRVLKPGEVWKGFLPGKWAVFHSNHSTYQNLAYSRLSSHFLEFDASDDSYLHGFKYVTSVMDKGEIDGIPKILFGNDLNFWLHTVMMVDTLSYLSFGKLELSLDRYIQIDVDDIFVGKEGIRMTVDDVEALVATQDRLQKDVDGFQFNLGYSGGFYLSGNDDEDEGDKKLLEHRNKFRWFSHMWKHEQPHKFPDDYVENSMRLNKDFAKEHKISVYGQYTVAPHHSGVYPVHEPMYKLWKEVWGVKTTSTEEYPKLMPAWQRRGFIHSGVMVLPRQTCGLFTSTIFASDYQGGLQGLDTAIQGGETFQTVLTTPISIFMTHLSNYGNDRLALYMLESLVRFIKCWTNLRLLSLPPVELGFKYFEMFPQEKEPVWTNPCDYYRHKELWPVNKTCDRLPDFIVVGPQKTGTTALYSFLSRHSSVTSNKPSLKTFEEIQFFNSNNYYLGLDWYMDFFPQRKKPNDTILFEKSANYFDSEVVPRRVSALVPRAKIVVLLMNPAKRALSWYYHMRYHKDPTALNTSFHDIITAGEDAPSKVKRLQSRCLAPGLYAQHLVRWLDYFPAKQIHIVHSDELKNDPVSVMENLQKFLHVEPQINYARYLRYDPVKGFYCVVLDSGQTECLGKSKGHKYPPMDKASERHLRRYYKKHNTNLSKLLASFNSEVPEWLKQELKEVTPGKS
ncbi:hypothetical protein RRG08_009606 [Elysia crispata]|uniref:[heparan sulfate]-glucosamine N-sulfotransferase n=1 Tax=Elysia crispata TaxID=231223 RepID=A0AAE0XTF6_9GAST|nr:hypothetical protein RRG08_009606 [Elysia crispata]